MHNKQDTRLIQHGYEWIILIGDLLALAIITLALLMQSIAQSGWRW